MTSNNNFRDEARVLLERFLADSSIASDKQQLIDLYAQHAAELHRYFAHQILNEIVEETHTRLDARLSPDPLRQTIATVQTTVQDVWKSIWGP